MYMKLSGFLLSINRIVSLFKNSSVLSKSESVKFSLIEPVICLFTDSPVTKYLSLLNQLIFTEVISEI